MNDATPPAAELFVTQFLVVSDQDRSRDFYQSVFGADLVRDRDPVSIPARVSKTVLSLRNPSARPTGRKTRAAADANCG